MTRRDDDSQKLCLSEYEENIGNLTLQEYDILHGMVHQNALCLYYANSPYIEHHTSPNFPSLSPPDISPHSSPFYPSRSHPHQHIGKLTAENNRLEDENENLRNEIAALSDRVDKLNSQIEELPTATLEVTEPEITIQSIRTAIQQAYQDAAHDDCTGDQILHMVWGFEYLLQRLGVE